MQSISNNQFSPDKILFHSEKLIEILEGKVTFPSVYEVSPVGFCNQKCVYCVSQNFRAKDKLSLVQARSIFAQISKLEGRAVTITGGGEPLLHPEIEEIIVGAKSFDLSVGIITNGTYSSPKLSETIAKNASFCRFSFDTVDNVEYERIRGTKHLALSLQNVAALVKEKQKQNTEVLIGVQMVWVDQSPSEIEDMARFFKKIHVDFFQIRPLDNVPLLVNAPRMNIPKDADVFLAKLRDTYSSKSFKVIPSTGKWAEVFDDSVGKSYTGCSGANLTASIGHDNKVYFCCSHIGNPMFSLGDLSRQSLKDILLAAYRTQLIHGVNHNYCQNQCRNHELNKRISKLAALGIPDVKGLIAMSNQNPEPLHWEFL